MGGIKQAETATSGMLFIWRKSYFKSYG